MAKKTLKEEKEVQKKKSSVSKEGKNTKTTKKTSSTPKNEEQKVKGKKTLNSKNETKKVDAKKVESKKKVEEKIIKEETIESSPVLENNVSTEDSSKKRIPWNVVISIFVVFVFVGVFIASIVESKERGKYFNPISFNEVSEIMSGSETEIIYWASPDCSYCSMFTPIIKEVSYEYRLTFNYLNTNSLSNDGYATMYTYFSEYDEKYNSSNLGTPSLILVNDGKISYINVGYMAKEDLIEFLKDYKLIEE